MLEDVIVIEGLEIKLKELKVRAKECQLETEVLQMASPDFVGSLEDFKELESLTELLERLKSSESFFQSELDKVTRKREKLLKDIESYTATIQEIKEVRKCTDKDALYQACGDIIALKKKLSSVAEKVLTELLGTTVKVEEKVGKGRRKKGETEAQNLKLAELMKQQIHKAKG